VTRELTAKGLREVKPEEKSGFSGALLGKLTEKCGCGGSANWGCTARTTVIHWGFIYSRWILHQTTRAPSAIELLMKKHAIWLAVVCQRKIIQTDPDKIWKTADSNIKNAFKRYPPSPKTSKQKNNSGLKKRRQEVFST